MAIAKSDMLSACRKVFGHKNAEKNLSRLKATLENLQLRTAQITSMSVRENNTVLRMVVKVPAGSVDARRELHFNKHFQVVLDETKQPKPPELGFGQQLRREGDPFQAQREMGDDVRE